MNMLKERIKSVEPIETYHSCENCHDATAKYRVTFADYEVTDTVEYCAWCYQDVKERYNAN